MQRILTLGARMPEETRGSIENDADGRNIADANDKAADSCTISVDDQTDAGNDVPRELPRRR